jgi:multiple sugar transport system substrate-binding protein
MINRKLTTLLASVAVLTLACSGSSATQTPNAPGSAAASMAPTASSAPTASAASGASGTCQNTIVNASAPQVTIWAWYAAFKDVANLFNQTHNDVQVCWTGSAVGTDEYTKFNATIAAGTGAPDVVMIEDEIIPSYVLQKVLVDQTKFGANNVAANYPAGFWKNVSVGSGVYGIPVDGGPMGLYYRADIFQKYGLTVPKTWAEFEQTAKALKAAGAPGVLTDFPTNGRAFNQALMAQAGGSFFTWDPTNPTTIGITLDNQPAATVLNYWQGLIKQGLVSADDAFTTDYNTKLATGGYAVYVAAAWGAGYLSGIAGQDPTAVWRAAPLPQWDLSNPVQADWGGSSFAVTAQSKQPALAAEVAQGLYASDAAWKIAIETGGVFPVWKPILTSDYFKTFPYALFGGQHINNDVFLAAVDGYKGLTFSPFQNFVYDTQTTELAAVAQGTKTVQQALADLQTTVANYATQQGFTVTH